MAAIGRASAAAIGKRQVEALAQAAAVDFETFFVQTKRPGPDDGQVVVLSADGKGVVMRPEGLRSATRAKAKSSQNKLKGRLSKGEKTNRKRMAEVGAVYSVTPVPRSAQDVMAHRGAGPPKEAPTAAHKWVTASVVCDAASVIASVFDEAERRDPGHHHDWVALVDGNRHQIDRIEVEATARGVEVTVVVDWVHVLEYIWSAAWSFFAEGDPAAEDWVHDKAIDVLSGRASIVAAAIRRKATTWGLDKSARKNADACADYLLAKVAYLDYPTALSKGWPIATGVIEGSCRYVVKDRMDITGARWGLEGAEAVLKLRALRANDCWDDYWSFHVAQERRGSTNADTSTAFCPVRLDVPPREPHPFQLVPVLRRRGGPTHHVALPLPVDQAYAEGLLRKGEPMKVRRSVWVGSVLATAAAVSLLGGTAQSGPASAGDQATARGHALRDSGAPRRVSPKSAPIIMGVWRNGQFHIIRLKTQRSTVSLPDGSSAEENLDVTTQAEVQAQLPPVNHAFDGAVPTQAQIGTMKEAVDAEGARVTAAAFGPEVGKGPAGPEGGRPPAAPGG